MRGIRTASLAGLATSTLVVGALAIAPAPAWAGVSTSAPVVINEVYGGGGNSGATLKQDFIELYNKSDSAVNLAGWSVQYASATGTTWATTALTGTLPAGAHYVVREAQGGAGTVDVVGDVTGTIAMGAAAGKVALVNTTAPLTCGADCDGASAVVDFVGFGTTATDFAGAGAAPAPSATNSVSRNVTHDNTANNAADFTAGAPSPTACGTACTTVTPPPDPTPTEKTIAEIQGPGATSPLADGTVVTTKGIVTAAYPTGGFKGYYIQTPGTGGPVDPASDTTSDGIFVFQASGTFPTAVQVGNYVQVTGSVTEFFGMTELNVAAADVVDLGAPPAAVTAATTNGWPATNAARESLEGMLYRPTGAFTVTNTFTTNQYGEVGLASGTKPLIQRTEVEKPGPAASSAVEADNAARAVTLDDGSSTNFLATSGGLLVNGDLTPPYISQTAPVRVGEAVTFTKDVVLDYRNNAWKLQPTATVTGPDNTGSPVTFNNTRTAAPDEAFIGQADLKVASFNVLNYFTTLGTDGASCVPFKDRDGDGSTVSGGCDQRGAWDAEDLARQQAKIVKAINALDADVVGLMEIENSARLGEPKDEALTTLVGALNADAGAGTWAANPSSAELPPVADMDVINSAIIYKPAAVGRVGASRALGTQSAAGGAFDNAREPLGQVFHPVAGGSDFLFVVNHFKSKGSAGPWPGDADTGDGQGSSTESRVRQATALRDWVPTVLASTGTKGVVMVGDYNSYSQEDPLQVLYSAGYTDVEKKFDHGEYSYSFSGLSGSLDHVLVNAEALERSTGADIWNINSPESTALEYSRYNYTATDFFQPDPYASSDHDPVVLGLAAGTPTETVQVLGINDFHGRIAANGVEAGAGVLAGAVKQLRTQYPETVFAAAGDLIGASTFESFIAHDKPTLDALNSAGLEVSAVGNHEFDQGYDDLVNRVMAPYDATTNPYGGANWKYLGANVRKAADHSAALPETWMKDVGGVQVGFIGAVTDHLSELVSPAGIAGLEIESPVVAANRHAEELKAAGRRHRRAARARGCGDHRTVLGDRPGHRLRQDRHRRQRRRRRDHLRSHPPLVQPLGDRAGLGERGTSGDDASGGLGRSVRLQPRPAAVHRRPRHRRGARAPAEHPAAGEDAGLPDRRADPGDRRQGRRGCRGARCSAPRPDHRSLQPGEDLGRHGEPWWRVDARQPRRRGAADRDGVHDDRCRADRLHEPRWAADRHGGHRPDVPDDAHLQAGGQRAAVRQHPRQHEADRRAHQGRPRAAVAAGGCRSAVPQAGDLRGLHLHL